MKTLWIDTGPLLELTVLELRGTSRGTYDRLRGLVRTFTSRARLLAFLARVSQFGEVRYSIGTLVELDRLVRSNLPRGLPSYEPMRAFWQCFDSAVPARLARPLIGRPLERAALALEDVAHMGPVDAHLLAVMKESIEFHLVTIDAALHGIATGRSHGRAFLPV